jgi:transcriptional regulator with XRE-family HTH domain
MRAVSFAGRLRELRIEAGLTQDQLADKAGVKRETVARWEQGTREPSWSNVIALVEALGVECTAFMQPPASAERPGPGRPRKEPVADAGPSQPKRPRGRPRKGTDSV